MFVCFLFVFNNQNEALRQTTTFEDLMSISTISSSSLDIAIYPLKEQKSNCFPHIGSRGVHAAFYHFRDDSYLFVHSICCLRNLFFDRMCSQNDRAIMIQVRKVFQADCRLHLFRFNVIGFIINMRTKEDV